MKKVDIEHIEYLENIDHLEYRENIGRLEYINTRIPPGFLYLCILNRLCQFRGVN